MKWTGENIPSQRGKTVVITGANSGLGFQTSLALARKGARVIMACRNMEKGELARQKILDDQPEMIPELWHLDLSSLSSVRSFAEKFLSAQGGPHLLINNAGQMAIPYMKTADGFEMQFGVNHLGHFALTALLWPGMQDIPGARIVSVGSIAYLFGRIRFGDIHWEKRYHKWGAYGMSKLANLLFIKELSRRLDESKSDIRAVAAHPGYADSSLLSNSMLLAGSRWKADAISLVNRLVAQSEMKGALPSLCAATAPGAGQGEFFGPDGFLNLWGWPAPEKPNPSRVNAIVARELWKLSEELTGIKFSIASLA
ncbi:MAG: oxidoreductase [Bacteroidota bacterium]